MIADKIIPSFYLLDVSGKATSAIVDGDFGIQQVLIGSKEFECDFLAMDALQRSVQFIVDNMVVDSLEFSEKVQYNPDFFPSMPRIQVSEDEALDMEEQEAQAALMAHELYDSGKFPVVLTQNFDELGDFVESKWTIEGKEFSIIAKIAANPNSYIQEKVLEKVTTFETIDRSKITTTTAVH